MMTEETALALMRFVERFGEAFNDATAVTLRMEDADEAKRVRKILGGMIERSFDLTDLVTRQYPELNPEKGDY
jgi:hypothetical protein